jgi:hypothetical protein
VSPSMGCWLLLVKDFQIFKVIPLRLLRLSCRRLPFNFNGRALVFLHLVGQARLFRRFGWPWHGELLNLTISICRLCRWRLVGSKFSKVEFLDDVGCNSQDQVYEERVRGSTRRLIEAVAANDLRVAGVAFRARRANKELCKSEVRGFLLWKTPRF